MFSKVLVSAGFVLVSGLAALPSHAIEKDVVVKEVDLSIYNLTTEKGLRAAATKIKRSAKSICGYGTAQVSLHERKIARECYDDALEKVVADYQLGELESLLVKQ